MRIVKAGLLTLLLGHAIPSFGQAGVTAPGNFAGALMGTSVPTYVAGQEYLNATAGTSFTSSPFDSTGADLLVMFLGCHNHTVFTITDSYGNAWLPLAGPAYKVGSAYYPMEGELFYAPNATTRTGHTITVGLSQSEPLIMSIAALSGDNIYSPIDAYSFVTGDNGDASKYIASSPLTTFQPNDLLVGMIKGFYPNTYTAGTGYTSQPASARTTSAPRPGRLLALAVILPASRLPTATFGRLSWRQSRPNPLKPLCPGRRLQAALLPTITLKDARAWAAPISARSPAFPGSTLTYTDATSSSGTVYRSRPRPELRGNLQPLFHCPGAQPDHTVRRFQLDRDSGQNAGLERLGGKRRLDRASTRSRDVVEYSFSDFSQIATTPSTSYTDTSAVAGTTYNYRVRAQDANNSYGPYSVVATASIPAYFDNAADGGNNGGSTTSLIYSYTVGTNSNRLLLVNLIGDLSADDISSVTYAGAPINYSS